MAAFFAFAMFLLGLAAGYVLCLLQSLFVSSMKFSLPMLGLRSGLWLLSNAKSLQFDVPLPPKPLFLPAVHAWAALKWFLDALLPAELRLSWLSAGYWASDCLYVFARLGVADVLASRRRAASASEIAQELSPPVHAENLQRLLRFLAALGVLRADGSGRHFSLTPMGRRLCSGPGSLAPCVLCMNDSQDQRLGWSRIEDAVREGGCGFLHATGTTLWDHYDKNPHLARRADESFAAGFGLEVATLARDFPWSRFESVVDVGGGSGAFARQLTEGYPKLAGSAAVFDRPDVASAARAAGGGSGGAAGGIKFYEGSFFEKVEPAGAAAYILKHVLHDWDDAECRRILASVAAAMRGGGAVAAARRLLIIDPVVEGPADPLGAYKLGFDVHMMAMCSGRERTLPEWKALLGGAGFGGFVVHPTRSISSIIEARLLRPS